MKSTATAYAAHRERAAARQKSISRAGRDIGGEYPRAGRRRRREACRRDLRRFLETYCSKTFPLPWSEDHLRIIGRIQDVVLDGGQLAIAMPRGSGKTVICERAALWALLYGHRRFVSLIGATEPLSEGILDSIRNELQYNDLLAADFRQVCYPIRCLGGDGRKSIGQLLDGERTQISLGKRQLTFPTIPAKRLLEWEKPDVSGSTVTVSGITGALKGQKHTLRDGTVIRPELVLVDDPQTRESALSPAQNAERLAIINGDVLGMAGPARRIAALCAITVIFPGDLADRMLDRKQSPHWQGERTKMIYTFPSDEKLWRQYADVLRRGLEAGTGLAEATEFYRANQAAMDAGARVAWPARFDPSELSAIQSAMNLKLRNEEAFWAEYQNEPLRQDKSNEEQLSRVEILSRGGNYARGQVPLECSTLTAFVDVQGQALFWLVCGWSETFTGFVLDYGTHPDQGRSHFSLNDIRRTLAMVHKGAGLEGSIYAGLNAVAGELLGREWRRADGAMLRINRLCVDANWGESTDTVYKWCRETSHAAVVMPSHGRYVGAASRPFAEYRRQDGERVGHHWRVPVSSGKRAIRYFLMDVNYWKTFLMRRLRTAEGDPGALMLFAGEHGMLADHLTSEYFIEVEAAGRRVAEWKSRPGKPDNHWWDCLVGCAAGASLQGVAMPGGGGGEAKRKKIKLSEIVERSRRAG